MQLGERVGEAAGQVADFVPGADFAAQSACSQTSVLVDGGAGLTAQLANAPGEASGERQQGGEHRDQCGHRQQDDLLEGLPLKAQDVIDVLLHHDRADHGILGDDGMRRHDDFKLIVHPVPGGGRATGEGRADDVRSGVFNRSAAALRLQGFKRGEAVQNGSYRFEALLDQARSGAFVRAGSGGFRELGAGFGPHSLLGVDDQDAGAGVSEPLDDVEHFRGAQHDQVEAFLASLGQGLRQLERCPGNGVIHVGDRDAEVAP